MFTETLLCYLFPSVGAKGNRKPAEGLASVMRVL
jgi:hypothetical protein